MSVLSRSIFALTLLASGPAFAKPQIVVAAVGASQTFGKGVARNESYPAQLELLLRADRFNARVVNLGVNGETTAEMLAGLSRVPRGTRVVILQPGSNDRRQGMAGDREGNIAAIESRLQAQGAQVIMMENSTFRSFERGPDGQHLTPAGYHALAQSVLPEVESALGGR